MIGRVKNFVFLILGVALISWSFYTFLQKPVEQGLTLLKIEEKTLKVEIADNDFERARGLSGRQKLREGHGILFIFPEPGLHGFWMKDMNFPIDIVWLERIDNSFRIVGIEQNVPPESFPKAFYPQVPVRFVLEVNAAEL